MKNNTPEEDNYLKSIGLRIKENRKKKGITQEEFAQMLETKQPNIARIESGKQNISILIYKKIAVLLGMNIEDLLKE